MSEENVIETPEEELEVVKIKSPEEEANSAEQEPTEKSAEAKKRAGDHLKDAIKQVESFGQALSEALQGRANVVMVRVNDDSLKHLDMLVEAEITSSRSESAAFLISEGIKANQTLFDKISAITEQIAELREQLRQEVSFQDPKPEEPEEKEPSEDEEDEA